MEASILVYDGDCGFCAWCAGFIRRRIPTAARIVPWQSADLDSLGLTAAQCAEAVQWVGADGDRVAGPEAFARLLSSSTAGWRALGTALGLRPVRALAWPVYRWVARNRHRMPGGTSACAVPSTTRDRR